MTKVGRRKEGQRPDNVTLDLKVHKHIKEAMSTNKYIYILCYHIQYYSTAQQSSPNG